MKNGKHIYISYGVVAISFLFLLTGCVSTRAIKEVTPASEIETGSPNFDGIPRGPKYRVAIARFEDKTGYGDNIFGVVDDLGEQAADVLASHLIKSGRVIVVERQESDLVAEEKVKIDSESDDTVWSNALIFGSVTECGTKTEYARAAFEKAKVQTAHAKVTIRMVDPVTSVAFYSEFGEANAMKESRMKMGYGGMSGYDATLTDKALNGAIVKLVSNMVTKLIERQWEAKIIDVQGQQVFINAGERTGIAVDDLLDVVVPGKLVKNPSSNASIRLPGKKVGLLKVVSLFGTSDLDEGAVCEVIEGDAPNTEHIVNIHEE